MSRSSLRRQLFHRNIDALLHSSVLDVVEEEVDSSRGRSQVHYTAGNHEMVTDLDATCSSPCDGDESTLVYNSPIYKPKTSKEAATNQERETLQKPPPSERDSERRGTMYSEPWGPQLTQASLLQPSAGTSDTQELPRQPIGGKGTSSGPGFTASKPGTTYTEIGEPSRPSQSPLKFQFPNPKPGSSGQLRDNDLQFSPIPHSKATGTSRLACGSSVRALPMSPALFLTQTTSTPGPSGVAMDSPTCHSIIEENNNTIFNFPECNMCRICHEDGSKERLWSPCHCKGTMGMLHLSCLETWLGSSNTTRCEICHFEFIVEKKPRPFKWYMKEPSLKTDRWVIIRDACMTVCLAILVLVVTVLCLVFAEKLRSEDRLGPAMVLVMIATCAIILFAIWIMVAVSRVRHCVKHWHSQHHVLTIKQRTSTDEETSRKKIFYRFSVYFSRDRKGTERNLSARQSIDNPNLCSSFTFINCSVGSYKTAMMSPVTPKEPLLCAGWDENDDEVTSLDESSPSVVSPDSFYDDGVSYYQPPELGTTALLSYDAGVVKETGV
ncbi:uncharacterized protein LOC128222979 [Mya arenaria]|uniref:uncharacterized protein LOC128222979 n=1 Tax=Mya arenaria TaxID=6604 RepID=UPI0022DF7A40|nr:uncharacterized protein LOC128222979 [Mya arenaria]